jgi:hypothetical protein
VTATVLVSTACLNNQGENSTKLHSGGIKETTSTWVLVLKNLQTGDETGDSKEIEIIAIG